MSAVLDEPDEQNAVLGPDEATPDVAPGGWRRVILGLLIGLAAGAVLALLLPRERRSSAGIEQSMATGEPVHEPDHIETPGSATEVGEADAEDR